MCNAPNIDTHLIRISYIPLEYLDTDKADIEYPVTDTDLFHLVSEPLLSVGQMDNIVYTPNCEDHLASTLTVHS